MYRCCTFKAKYPHLTGNANVIYPARCGSVSNLLLVLIPEQLLLLIEMDDNLARMLRNIHHGPYD